MSDLPDELPSDRAELRVFAAALLDRCAKLERLLKLAKDAQFGRCSETLDADQLQLVLEDSPRWHDWTCLELTDLDAGE